MDLNFSKKKTSSKNQSRSSSTIRELEEENALMDNEEPLKSPTESNFNPEEVSRSPDRHLPCVSSIRKLHSKENDDYNDFLGSFEKPFEPHFKTQFYTDPLPVYSENQLNRQDEEEHFKSSLFPHPYKPFASSNIPHPHQLQHSRSEASHKHMRNSTKSSRPHSDKIPRNYNKPDDAQHLKQTFQNKLFNIETLEEFPEVFDSPDRIPSTSPSTTAPPSTATSFSTNPPSTTNVKTLSRHADDDDVIKDPVGVLVTDRHTSHGGMKKKMSRVHFILGADDEGTSEHVIPPNNDNQSAQKRRKSSHKKRQKIGRRKAGSEVFLEGSHLSSAEEDMDDLHVSMSNHRFEDTKALRHRMIDRKAFNPKPSYDSPVRAQEQDHELFEVVPKLNLDVDEDDDDDDHQVHHEMFVEMDELCTGEDSSQYEWREKARWIKYEEDVQEEAGKWGKPHVSSLSFHSLVELKKCIEKGVVDLEMECDGMESISEHVARELVDGDHVTPEQSCSIMHVLLLKHSHLSVPATSSKKAHNMGSSPTFANMASSSVLKLKLTRKHKTCTDMHSEKESEVDKHIDWAGDNQQPSIDFKTPMTVPSKYTQQLRTLASTKSLPASYPVSTTPTTAHKSPHILKRIPEGAEATNVLVGTAPFLTQPISAFVRLKQATCLQNVTEVPTVPVRFLFIFLGPASSGISYHEVGRSISTLMADQTFHDAAYEASTRSDLLDSLNHFLNHSMVLPPGDWHKNTLLPIVNHSQRHLRLLPRKKKSKKLRETPSYDPLKRQGRCFGGLIMDFKSRLPYFPSDFSDGLNFQCLAVIIFVYFACLSPAITFGGLLGEKTDKLIGVSEMLVATAICGTIFSLFSGQPLIIIGATGPVIIFEEALYKICKQHDIVFLPFRCWVGVWVAVITTVVVAFEGSVLVRYITRFTEEIFALLISLIFVYEVFKKLFYVFQKNPLMHYYPPPTNHTSNYNNSSTTNFNASMISANNTTTTANTTKITFNLNSTLLSTYNTTNSLYNTTTNPYNTLVSTTFYNNAPHPNTALFTLILTMSTFLLAFALKKFRNSKFLGRSARRAIGDFGVPISIVVMTTVALLIPNTFTEKLDVPEGLTPTAPLKRDWLVSPFHASLFPWLALLAIVPSMLVFILLYMESVITSMIVNKKDRCLRKGSGYHLDLFVTGICTIICGFMGLPFMCSATVRSLTHVSALSVFSRTHAPGDKPHLVTVVEQRVTSLCVHLLIGASVLMGAALRNVPLAVLFGIFLYMGVASMSGIQLLRRCKLLFKPVKHHPDVGYVKRVRQFRMHLFTLIQLFLLALLWVVKLSPGALAFPFILILFVPIRLHLLKLIFTDAELRELDKEEESSESEEVEPDFYTQAHMPV